MAGFFRRNKSKKGPTALSEEELDEISGGYEQISADILGKTVYRGIDGNGDEFYTIDETLAKSADTSGKTKFDTPFNKDAASKAIQSGNNVIYPDNM